MLQARIEAGERVVVDVSEAEFIDSSVITSLVAADRAARQRGGHLTLQLGAAAKVRQVLTITRVIELLPWADSREGAIEAARNGHLAGNGWPT